MKDGASWATRGGSRSREMDVSLSCMEKQKASGISLKAFEQLMRSMFMGRRMGPSIRLGKWKMKSGSRKGTTDLRLRASLVVLLVGILLAPLDTRALISALSLPAVGVRDTLRVCPSPSRDSPAPLARF